MRLSTTSFSSLRIFFLFSFSTGFLTILLFTVVTGVASLLIRTHLQLAEDTTAWQVSMLGLVMSSITSTAWVTTNPQLSRFTVDKIKGLVCPGQL